VSIPKTHHRENNATSWNPVILNEEFRYEVCYNFEEPPLKLKVYASTMLREDE
jgi:hypothetical protein